MNHSEPEDKICPSLGLLEDEDSSYAFPSNLNYCHHRDQAVSIQTIHQEDFCLSGKYRTCPVYLYRQARPPALSAQKRPARKVKADIYPWKIASVVAVVLLAAFVFWRGSMLSAAGGQEPGSTFTPQPASVATATPTQTATETDIPLFPMIPEVITDIPTLTLSPAATFIPTLTRTPTPTPTSILVKRRLDIPFGSNNYKFLIHKSADGEKLETFAQKYNTTVAAILAINYHLTNPVWSDVLFVVPVGFSNVDGLPVFVIYQIKEEERGISPEELAAKLRVNLYDLEYYNDLLEKGARPLVGDLILVPWANADTRMRFGEPGKWDK